MKPTRLAFAGFFILLASAAWCQVIQTKITVQPGIGWGSAANVHDVAGGASVFNFSIRAGRAHRSANPQVTIQFAADVWDQTPVCHLSRGWSIEDVSQEKLRIHWKGKPRASRLITAAVNCSD